MDFILPTVLFDCCSFTLRVEVGLLSFFFSPAPAILALREVVVVVVAAGIGTVTLT